MATKTNLGRDHYVDFVAITDETVVHENNNHRSKAFISNGYRTEAITTGSTNIDGRGSCGDDGREGIGVEWIPLW